MRRPFTLVVLLLALVLLCEGSAWAETSPAGVRSLRVDHIVDPLGIDNPAPSLGWQLSSPRRGERQLAYRVQVAKNVLDLETQPLWDSGRVDSSESVDVPYAGPPLASGERYVWRVRVWDRDNAETAWSDPASWEMGLLSPSAWRDAQWISPQAPTDAAGWGDYRVDVDFTIAAGAAGLVFRARDPSNFYMWQVRVSDDEVLLRPHVLEDGDWDVLEEIDIEDVVPLEDSNDPHHLAIEARGETIRTEIDGELVDEREDEKLARGAVGFRSGDASEDASFDNLVVRGLPGEEGLFADDFATAPDPAFPGAEIAAGRLRARDGGLFLIATSPSVPLLRKEFDLDHQLDEVVSARAYVYGLGLYELRLSGSKVGDRVLTPAASRFQQRQRYQTFDVTSLLRENGNALGLTLAEGYGPAFSRFGWRWQGPRQALLLLDVAYESDDHQYVVSDETWRWSDGPHRAASIYGGETYDARLEQDGWDAPGFDAEGWGSVRVTSPPSGSLEADTTPPVRVMRTLRPTALTEPRPGVYVFDMGENIAGWARLHAQAPTGTVVQLRFAEDLAPGGDIDTFTNRYAAATDTFVVGDDDSATFEPSFTYHGFRYVEVTGLPSPPTLDTLDGRVVHADLPRTSTFDSSNPLLDQIHANNRRAMENNAMSYPTDNPVRDERTGPGMDVQAYVDAAALDFDADRFLEAYLQEIDGEWGGSPDMNAAHVPIAWALYEQYGDRDALASAYPDMTDAVDAYGEEADDWIWPWAGGEEDSGFGDWCPPIGEPEANGGLGGPQAGGYAACFSEVSLVNTALAHRAARIVAEAGRALGEASDAVHYEEVADEIAAAFEQRFANGDGYSSGRQVTSVLPLVFGMVPPDRRQAASQGLVDRVLGPDGGHLDTGIFGTRYLVDALVGAGRPDVALTVLDQSSYPGFGFQIGLGATTAWEQWIYRSGMGSHDHAMFAGVNASLLTEFGGIEPIAPGYEEIRIAPALPAGLDHLTTSLQTVRGEVVSAWRRTESGMELDVTVPPNATAEVHVPRAPADEVRESGLLAEDSPGVTFERESETAAVYGVGAGEYRFTAAPPAPGEPEETDDASELGQPNGEEIPSDLAGTQPARPHPRLRLRVTARATPAGRLMLAIACRASCPDRPRGIRVTVTAPGRPPVVLARRRARLGSGSVRLTIHPDSDSPPRHVEVKVAGLSQPPFVATVRVAEGAR